MKKKMFLYILLFFLGTTVAHSELIVDVGLVYEKGIDKDLILSNELHSRESVFGHKEIKLSMKNGIHLILRVRFIRYANSYGPSDKVLITGSIYGPTGEMLDDLGSRREIISLGEEKSFSYNTDSQRIEVKVSPFLR